MLCLICAAGSQQEWFRAAVHQPGQREGPAIHPPPPLSTRRGNHRNRTSCPPTLAQQHGANGCTHPCRERIWRKELSWKWISLEGTASALILSPSQPLGYSTC